MKATEDEVFRIEELPNDARSASWEEFRSEFKQDVASDARFLLHEPGAPDPTRPWPCIALSGDRGLGKTMGAFGLAAYAAAEALAGGAPTARLVSCAAADLAARTARVGAFRGVRALDPLAAMERSVATLAELFERPGFTALVVEDLTADGSPLARYAPNTHARRLGAAWVDGLDRILGAARGRALVLLTAGRIELVRDDVAQRLAKAYVLGAPTGQDLRDVFEAAVAPWADPARLDPGGDLSAALAVADELNRTRNETELGPAATAEHVRRAARSAAMAGDGTLEVDGLVRGLVRAACSTRARS